MLDLRRNVEPETVKRQLFKLTSIESSFGFNTLAIVEGKPKILNLKEFISEFVNFREKTLTKKIKFDLNKALEKAHILIGLSVSVENIDSVIKIIKNSETVEIAKKSLLSKKWKINKTSKLIKLIRSFFFFLYSLSTSLSESKTGIFKRRICFATVDFPEPIPPVSPTIIIFLYCLYKYL